MRKLRIAVLMHEKLVPPAAAADVPAAQFEECRTEFDVMRTLEALGHEVRSVGLHDNLSHLRDVVTDWKPDVAFNLLNEFQGILGYDHYVIGYLELMKLPYTGCNPRGMMLSRDKVLSKQLLSYHHVPVPMFVRIERGRRYALPKRLRYPLFVKSATEDASLGIAQASIVEDESRLRQRIDFIHENVQTDAIVEEYIDGREVYVGVLGNDRLTTLPPWEMHFGTMTQSTAGIATRKAKWDKKYQRKHGIDTARAEQLPEGVQEQLARLSRRAYRGLHMSGCARMDYRVTADGLVYLLEANSNPNLAADEDLARSAASAGIDYGDLLQRIVNLGMAYQAEWRHYE